MEVGEDGPCLAGPLRRAKQRADGFRDRGEHGHSTKVKAHGSYRDGLASSMSSTGRMANALSSAVGGGPRKFPRPEDLEAQGGKLLPSQIAAARADPESARMAANGMEIEGEADEEYEDDDDDEGADFGGDYQGAAASGKNRNRGGGGGKQRMHIEQEEEEERRTLRLAPALAASGRSSVRRARQQGSSWCTLS